MPLTPLNIAESIGDIANAFPFEDSYSDRLWLGIGLGLWTWAVGKPMNLALTGMATGPAGDGVIMPVGSKIIIPIPAAIPIMRAALAGAGINGVTANPMAFCVATGICRAFAQYAGYTAPVAVGNGRDVSKVSIVNITTLTPILTATIASCMLGAGPALPMLALGLSLGIGGILLLGAGTATVVGVPSIPSVPVVLPTFSTVV